MTTSLSSCTLAFFLSPNPPPSFPAHTALFSHSFPELLVITTVKQEQMCGYQCGIITHHCSTVPAGHSQKGRFLLALSALWQSYHAAMAFSTLILPHFPLPGSRSTCQALLTWETTLWMAHQRFSGMWIYQEFPSAVTAVSFLMALEILLPPTHLCVRHCL